MKNYIYLVGLVLLLTNCQEETGLISTPESGDKIVLIGGNLGSRMMNFGHFETELHARYPAKNLVIRNMCDGGNTPGLRPHSARPEPWAFPGAQIYQKEEYQVNTQSEGHFELPDEWLERLEADVILAFFGYSESFEGEAGIDLFRNELDAFVEHTLAQEYQPGGGTELVLVSPTPFQNLRSEKRDLPDGKEENKNLERYAKVIQETAKKHEIPFLDLYTPATKWFSRSTVYTIDGAQLNDAGYQLLATELADQLYGSKSANSSYRTKIRTAVADKNWHWHNDIKMPNGVHVYGRRYEPYGSDNYPDEIIKIRQLTTIRDRAIWAAAQGKKFDLKAADAQTLELPAIETNYNSGATKYLYGEDALNSFTMAPGYKIELFASEEDFPDLANPCQLSFDNQGRLWVAVMPSYPHWRPGDPMPNDKLLILEDTDQDGKADQQTIFADSLHLPVGFEFAPEGVYVSQGTNLVLLSDTNDDNQADKKEIIFSGFDDHDTHHVISAFCADPSGAIYMGEGVFLHTDVETAYGTERSANGGFYRFDPNRMHLERTASIDVPNPWGIAFDEYGQSFFMETSGPPVRWLMPSTIKSRYGIYSPKSKELLEEKHRVRPLSGFEFISSRHFPESSQGDFLVNNSIGFLGAKQHTLEDEGTGYASRHAIDLYTSSDPNFRPVDVEFAPDGSLYVVDWHNVLVGHMQHNARDPLRDHQHGRIYRVTYPSRPLVEPAKVAGASIGELFQNLELPESRTRYRTRRELRGRNQQEVLTGLKKWIKALDTDHPDYERFLLEGLWVSWGINRVDEELLKRLLAAKDERVRAGAVQVLRYNGHRITDQSSLLAKAATDSSGRVRLTAVVAASWLPEQKGKPIISQALNQPVDEWMRESYSFAMAHVQGQSLSITDKEELFTKLEGRDRELFKLGRIIYNQEGNCATCHQPNGKGLTTSGFPPLYDNPWTLGSKERLVKIILNGLTGPLKVMGQEYDGQVPMMAFGKLLTDEEIAGVATYVRNAFGNEESIIYPEFVKKVRAATKGKEGYWLTTELLTDHPLE